MSRLPSVTEKRGSAERIYSVILTEQLPILAPQIAKASETDKGNVCTTWELAIRQ